MNDQPDVLEGFRANEPLDPYIGKWVALKAGSVVAYAEPGNAVEQLIESAPEHDVIMPVPPADPHAII
jgi:hypothetical protein